MAGKNQFNLVIQAARRADIVLTLAGAGAIKRAMKTPLAITGICIIG